MSRAFFVPKPGSTPDKPSFRLVFDSRWLNSQCVKHSFKSHDLRYLNHMVRGQDRMVTFDISDGFYAVGIEASY